MLVQLLARTEGKTWRALGTPIDERDQFVISFVRVRHRTNVAGNRPLKDPFSLHCSVTFSRCL